MMRRNLDSTRWPDLNELDRKIGEKISNGQSAAMGKNIDEARAHFQSIFELPGFNATHPDYFTLEDRYEAYLATMN